MVDAAPIFICYAGPDRTIAVSLHAMLREAGLDPWCDAVDLQPGDLWDEAIPARLRCASIVVVLVTDRWPELGEPGPGFYNSEEVALAIRLARKFDTRVVPLLLDGADRDRVPYGLNRLKEIEARSLDLRAVGDALRPLATGASSPTLAPRDPLDDALARRARLTSSDAPGEVIDSLNGHILQLKRDRLHKRTPRAGLVLAKRWHLTEKLGKGGFAEVWKAWDEAADSAVAVKILHGQFDDSAERRQRFFRGARQMAALDHPHVVRAIQPEGEDRGWHFFVMEHLPGGDLERVVLAGRMPQHLALAAICDVADALDFAHGRGVIHRDVKPSNILLDQSGRAKLSDFDLVRAGDSTGGTRTGALGTFIYAAPESLDDAGRVTSACDIFGLGMSAAFALLAVPLPRRVLREPELVLAAIDGHERLKVEILRAIDWDPTIRHRSAAAFAAAIRRAMTPAQLPAMKPALERGAQAASPRRDQRSLVGFLVAVVVLLAPAAVIQRMGGTSDVLPDASGALAPERDASPVTGDRGGDTPEGALPYTDANLPDRHLPALHDHAAGGPIDAGAPAPETSERHASSVAVDGGLENVNMAPPDTDGDLPEGALPATRYRPAMLPIEAGVFLMGSPPGEAGRDEDEVPHRVQITTAFWMAETEVTQFQYVAVMGQNPSHFQGQLEDGARPIEQVSWRDAVEFCNRLSTREGLTAAYVVDGDAMTWDRDTDGYRLPTEAEWEYAARAGTETATPAGDLDLVGSHNAPVLDAIAWYGGNCGSEHPEAHDSSGWAEKQYLHFTASTQPVGGKQPNAWGLHDMLGNVYEWTWGWSASYPADGAPPADLASPPQGADRVIRGGSWNSYARGCRSAYRNWWQPGDRVADVGFRLVRPPEHLDRSPSRGVSPSNITPTAHAIHKPPARTRQRRRFVASDPMARRCHRRCGDGIDESPGERGLAAVVGGEVRAVRRARHAGAVARLGEQ